jgi:hypothetical protein
MSVKRTTTVVAFSVLAAWLGGSATAWATLPIQKKAKEAGVASTNCLYCHNEKLPKKGAVTNNDRGKWLVDEKEKRKVKEVDGAWLKDYVEKKKDEPAK